MRQCSRLQSHGSAFESSYNLDSSVESHTRSNRLWTVWTEEHSAGEFLHSSPVPFENRRNCKLDCMHFAKCLFEKLDEPR